MTAGPRFPGLVLGAGISFLLQRGLAEAWA
jgi:hypothetical protein